MPRPHGRCDNPPCCRPYPPRCQSAAEPTLYSRPHTPPDRCTAGCRPCTPRSLRCSRPRRSGPQSAPHTRRRRPRPRGDNAPWPTHWRYHCRPHPGGTACTAPSRRPPRQSRRRWGSRHTPCCRSPRPRRAARRPYSWSAPGRNSSRTRCRTRRHPSDRHGRSGWPQRRRRSTPHRRGRSDSPRCCPRCRPVRRSAAAPRSRSTPSTWLRCRTERCRRYRPWSPPRSNRRRSGLGQHTPHHRPPRREGSAWWLNRCPRRYPPRPGDKSCTARCPRPCRRSLRRWGSPHTPSHTPPHRRTARHRPSSWSWPGRSSCHTRYRTRRCRWVRRDRNAARCRRPSNRRQRWHGTCGSPRCCPPCRPTSQPGFVPRCRSS